MNRRSSLKALFIFSAGVALLPSCVNDNEKSVNSLKNIKVSDEEVEMLSLLGETIIPLNNKPVVKDIAAHQFVLMMVDDCFSPDNRGKFVEGLKQFEEMTNKNVGKSFIKCTPGERTALLKSVEAKSVIPADAMFFYSSMKKLTIQSYTTSEYYLTKVQIYKLVPGKFYGCVPVKKAS